MTDESVSKLTLTELQEAVAGGAVAIRGKATLQPAGGPGDKVFPPTHSVGERAHTRYAFERRRIGRQEVECVLLDSVQSQANRMEEALQSLWADKRIHLPVIEVDFSECAPDVGVITSLTAPHRIADALLRDSHDDQGTFFRMSEIGKSFTDSSARDAGPLFRVCPTGLVFGIWDSTGPKGGLGAKFARALTSEIIGVNATRGVKTASRIDPTGIVTKAADILVAADPVEGWTDDPMHAKKEKGQPVKFRDGKVSDINHSNIPPTLDEQAGGVTMDHAEQTVVLSLAALRKLDFGSGSLQARAVLAALGLLAVIALERRGHDLRSRCLLVPQAGGALSLEAIRQDGSTVPLSLDLDGAVELYEAAVKHLPEPLRFTKKPGVPLVKLTPSAKLAHLVTKSRELAGAGADVEEG